jgi:hypothetical protein
MKFIIERDDDGQTADPDLVRAHAIGQRLSAGRGLTLEDVAAQENMRFLHPSVDSPRFE